MSEEPQSAKPLESEAGVTPRPPRTWPTWIVLFPIFPILYQDVATDTENEKLLRNVWKRAYLREKTHTFKGKKTD